MDSNARFPLGSHEIGLYLVGSELAASLTEIRTRLDEARNATSFSGWPLFVNLNGTELQQYIHADTVEAWLGRPVTRSVLDSPALLDFWRVSTDGSLYSVRGYYEDGLPTYEPGTRFDVTYTAMQVAEALIFAKRFAESFAGVEQIAFRSRFTGLQGRDLVSPTSLWSWRNRCRTDTAELQGEATLEQIDDNLVELVYSYLVALYERFNFYQLPLDTVQSALKVMRR